MATAVAVIAVIALIAPPRPAHAQLLPLTSAPVVTITQPVDGSSVATTTPVFRGTAGTGLGELGTVTVKVYPGDGGGLPVESLVALAGGDGTWSVRSSGLREGSYTVWAEQVDVLGGVSRASAKFAVDVTAPETMIDSGPRDPINSASASFEFHAGEAGSTFECSLDGGAYAACAPGHAYSGLTDGRHSFAVRARDGAGNLDATPATFAWTIDTAAPPVTLAAPPDGASLSDATPSLSGAAGTAAGDSGAVTVRIYSGASASGTPVQTLTATRSGGSWSATTSELPDGTYTAQAEQRDAAGNTGRDGPKKFGVDVTPPETVIDSGPRDPINSASASFEFHASEDRSTFQCSLDGGAYATCASGQTYSGLAAGRHTFAVRARDRAGNVDASPATFAWTVDTAAPAVTLAVPADGASLSDATPSLSGAAGTAAGDSGTVTVRIYSGASASGTPVQTLTATRSGGSWSATASQLADGTYTAQAEQRDTAGNVGRSAPRTFAVKAGVTAPVIAAAGDIACDPASTSFGGGLGTSAKCRQKHTSDLLVGQDLAAVLPLGDVQYECAGYEAFMRSYDLSWGRLKRITFPAVGNHEYDTSGGTDCDASGRASGYFTYFGAAAGDPSKGYYSFDIGRWHIVALNSNRACAIVACNGGSAQEQWLKADLAAHPTRCTLAYWHAPRFSSAGNANSTLALWRALYAAGADVIVNGHVHNYERFAPMDPSGALDVAKGIRQFVVGTGGASHAGFKTILPTSEVRDASTYGVLKLTLRDTGYDWRFVPEAGKTFTDSGSTECH